MKFEGKKKQGEALTNKQKQKRKKKPKQEQCTKPFKTQVNNLIFTITSFGGKFYL